MLTSLNRFSRIGSIEVTMLENMRKKRITISDVAARAGVGKATVSYVLNASRTRVPISEPTRQRVIKAAMECGYHPNAAARALSTNRTGHIGFILSESVTGGWGNAYYAACLTGVEDACRAKGYGLNISRYNLSNVDTFVFPARVGQRCVDGLVLTGYIEAAVVQRFKEFDIPCVCIGDDVEVAELVPTIASDIVGGLYQAVSHVAGLGHTKIGYCTHTTRRGLEVCRLLRERTAGESETKKCRIKVFEAAGGTGDYNAGRPLLKEWLAMEAKDRPTAMIASDQTITAFMNHLYATGMHCPKDVSLISSCDTELCQMAYPALSAVDIDVVRFGRIAAEMLIDHLDEEKPLSPEMSKNDYPCKFVVRDSCGTLK